MSSNHNTDQFNIFLLGWVIGLFMAAGTVLYSLDSSDMVIETKTKLIPETRLITDGKVVDTLYIYKDNETR